MAIPHMTLGELKIGVIYKSLISLFLLPHFPNFSLFGMIHRIFIFGPNYGIRSKIVRFGSKVKLGPRVLKT